MKNILKICYLLCCTGLIAGDEPEYQEPDVLDSDRVYFVLANTVFVLFHELGHALIHEFDLPVLGEEEDAADTIATIILISTDRLDHEGRLSFLQVLMSAAEGQKLVWETGLESQNIDQFYWARHSLSVRRYHRIACLLYGSDPGRFAKIPNITEMPEHRSDSCEDEYELASRSVSKLGMQLRGGAPIGDIRQVEIPLHEDDTDDELATRLVGIMRERGTLGKVLNITATVAALPVDMDVSLEDCEIPGAYWDPEDDTLIFCYQLMSTFYDLSGGQKLPDILREFGVQVGGQP